MNTLLLLLALAPQDGPSWPGLEALTRSVSEHEITEPHDRFVEQLAGYLAYAKAQHQLELFEEMTRSPLEAPARAIELTDRLAAAASVPDLAALLREAAAMLDREPPEGVDLEPLLAEDVGFEERLSGILAVLRAGAGEVDAAFAPVEIGMRAELPERVLSEYEVLRGNVYVHTVPAHVVTWDVIRTVDQDALLRAAAGLCALADPRVADALVTSLRADRPSRPKRVEGVTGRLLFARETELGWVLIGSSVANTYDLPVAFLLDLGGADRYSPRTTRSGLDQPVNLVIDLAGDDEHGGAPEPGQGCGYFGVSMLVDREGDDVYRGEAHVQGAGVVGVGILLDASGDDTYEGDSYAQGSGAFGVGILVDHAGHDRMRSHIYSQGFAAPASVGLLIDVAGNDERTAKGKYPSSYGTEGEFSSHSQGSGLGFRTLDGTTKKAAGGFGILVDGGGNDVSTVGEFGFGVGYFMGTGIVRDMGGNDRVEASRYGIATGAHYGVGIVLDDGGDDFWRNEHTASLAGNWDLTLSFLLDAAGDDEYHGAGISLGGATITSLAAFVDADGKDSYATSGANCFANAGHPQDLDRKGRSLAFFLDLGGDEDVYPGVSLDPPPANDLELVRRRNHTKDETTAETGVGVFIDR